MGVENAENLFVAGDLFMQIYYSVFNRDTDMVGLALAKHKHKEVVVGVDDLMMVDHITN